MSIWIVGDVLTPTSHLRPGYIRVEGEHIVSVGAGEPPHDAANRIDARRGLIVPGFVDLHIHGAGGSDLMSGSDDVRAVSRFLPRTGCTAFLPTTITAPWPDTLGAIAAIADVCQDPDPAAAQPVGIHLEGPFLSHRWPGMAVADWIRPPDFEGVRALRAAAGSWLRSVTLAPEVPGALAVIEELCHSGVLVSVAHSDASYDAMCAAAEAGARHLTHAFNAMRGLHHREPGTIGGALDLPSFSVEVIADGVHVHPAILRLLWRIKGWRCMALVTDAMPAAGAREGVYVFGGQEVVVHGGSARLADGRLAGSVLRMDRAVGVAVAAGIPLSEAVGMASLTPAMIAGLTDRGQIAPGFRADLVMLDTDLRVVWTMVGGRVVWPSVNG